MPRPMPFFNAFFQFFQFFSFGGQCLFSTHGYSSKLENALQRARILFDQKVCRFWSKQIRGPQDEFLGRSISQLPSHLILHGALAGAAILSLSSVCQLTRYLPSRHCCSLAPLTALTGTTWARRLAFCPQKATKVSDDLYLN